MQSIRKKLTRELGNCCTWQTAYLVRSKKNTKNYPVWRSRELYLQLVQLLKQKYRFTDKDHDDDDDNSDRKTFVPGQ